ncbi:hypothetical protein BCR34DRAFT_339040 [Clohesyomyces aquaticus]|uniref:Uncharacterized protein n=1 Tax=Clohesyomyces aquaticus TaxID=1231657 RepID=A0A1Y1ZKX5_9PLEO|nr:hypothetical protein BCR34DRAFT_339040 [Clohesyomyces aquaticus]
MQKARMQRKRLDQPTSGNEVVDHGVESTPGQKLRVTLKRFLTTAWPSLIGICENGLLRSNNVQKSSGEAGMLCLVSLRSVVPRLSFLHRSLHLPAPTKKNEKKMAKTYNSRDSLLVTHATTNPLVSSLSTAKQTGSAIVSLLIDKKITKLSVFRR